MQCIYLLLLTFVYVKNYSSVQCTAAPADELVKNKRTLGPTSDT